MSKILIPINNNDSRETIPLNLPNGVATIYAFVNADRDLLVEVHQSFDSNLTYDKIESKQYSASNGGTAFYFDKIGSDAVLKLTNNSGQDCTFTRAYLDYNDSFNNINLLYISNDNTNTTAQNTSSLVVNSNNIFNKLDTVNSNLTIIDNNLQQTIQQSFNKYNFYGRNNEIALNSAGSLIYADSSPPPIRSPDYREGWLYFNDNAGNKFNYYYFSNTAFSVVANEIVGQFCVFENLVPTLENVNVLLAIYAGTNFSTDGRRVYTSNVKIKPGVKYLAYWGQDPGVFPALPRLEYTLASERNWNGDLNVLTMSVGSDSGYSAQTVGNLMTHVGYVDSEGPVTTSLIGSTDNINSGAQILKATKDASDILANTGNDIVQIRERLESGNAFQTNDAVVNSTLGDILGSSDSILSFLQAQIVNVEDTAVRNQLEIANNTLVLLGQKLDLVNTNLQTLIDK